MALLRALDAEFGPRPAMRVERRPLVYGSRAFSGASNRAVFMVELDGAFTAHGRSGFQQVVVRVRHGQARALMPAGLAFPGISTDSSLISDRSRGKERKRKGLPGVALKVLNKVGRSMPAIRYCRFRQGRSRVSNGERVSPWTTNAAGGLANRQSEQVSPTRPGNVPPSMAVG